MAGPCPTPGHSHSTLCRGLGIEASDSPAGSGNGVKGNVEAVERSRGSHTFKRITLFKHEEEEGMLGE